MSESVHVSGSTNAPSVGAKSSSGETKTLTRDETLTLYRKLATSDAFRQRYENDPPSALIELGIPESTVSGLSAACRTPSRLAPKEEFEKACAMWDKEAARESQSMIIPNLKLDGRQH